jgi:hypothetical protein
MFSDIRQQKNAWGGLNAAKMGFNVARRAAGLGTLFFCLTGHDGAINFEASGLG